MAKYFRFLNDSYVDTVEGINDTDGHSYFRVPADFDSVNQTPEVLNGVLVIADNGQSLNKLKRAKNKEINKRTGELIEQGYEFPPDSGNMFSLSYNAQINISALNQSRDVLTYPVDYNTIDDLAEIQIPDAATMNGMYLTALATKKAHIDSGTALKQQVRAATNRQEIENIIDNR